MRWRNSSTFVVTLLGLTTLNVAVLYFLSSGLLQYQAPSPCPDCSQYIKKVNIKDDFHQSFNSSHNSKPSQSSNKSILPIIYIVTPTYARPTQKADLTRLCYALMHVPQLHWIIVEDSETHTHLVERLLSGKNSCKMSRSTQLNIRTSEKLRRGARDPIWKKCRGAEQRNLGLEWLTKSAAEGLLEADANGVVYFGDDDNTYDLQVFKEMRFTKTVSMWPVGLSGGMKFEGPTCENGKVTGWYAMWDKTRLFRIDMAGFAVNLKLLLSKPTARFDIDSRMGHLESSLLKHLVTVEELEAKADDCSKVLVWHTRTEASKLKHEDELIKQGRPSNPLIEV